MSDDKERLKSQSAKQYIFFAKIRLFSDNRKRISVFLLDNRNDMGGYL